jgi:alcohol dehydrogenase class IV
LSKAPLNDTMTHHQNSPITKEKIMPSLPAVLFYRTKLLSLFALIKLIAQPRPAMYVGSGSSLQLCSTMAGFGHKHVLIVTDKPLVELGITDNIQQSLRDKGVIVTVFDGVLPDPTFAVVQQGIDLLQQQSCDCVLAVGGGSSLDAAKVIALAAGNQMSAEEMAGMQKAKNTGLPLYAIPTTAGTGSEVTVAAILSDNITHDKIPVGDGKLIPLAAALDPALMTGLPPAITAATGMDALTHAIESYIGIWGSDESNYYAALATRLIFENLATAYQQGDDMAAREAMALASYYAGLAFTKAMVGYVHAIAHQLGARYQVPHGLANAVVLPHVMELSKDKAGTRMAELARRSGLGDKGDTDLALAQRLIDRVKALSDEVGIPTTLNVIQAADHQGIAQAALKEGNGYPVPVYMDRQECVAILQNISISSSSS